MYSHRGPGPVPVRKHRAGPERFSFLLGELIGESLSVVDDACKDRVGLSGRIVDETRGTFLVLTASGERRVPKTGSRFRFARWPDVIVPGSWLVVRPEERTKRLHARFFRGR